MSIKDNYRAIKSKIKQLSVKYNRSPEEVQLLAVSKGRTIEEIKVLVELKQQDFAESYVKEAISKIEELANYKLVWHFIGRIQSNKAKEIAKWFDWVHSIDDYKKAKILDQYRGNYNLPPINVCIQVNVAESHKKSGFHIGDVDDAVRNINVLPKLRLRGFMTMIDHTDNFVEQTRLFNKLAELFDYYKKQGFSLDILSMGMSHDYEAAIACKATVLRIGSEIFGTKQTTLLYNEINNG